ncbi:MAG: hypothetical protein NVS1B6_18010 [Steroidobacteraceae bacterium]
MPDKIRWETNVPQTIALNFPNGKRVKSEYNEYEVLYSTVDGRALFANPTLDDKIQALDPKRGEALTICLREIKLPGEKPRKEWQVSRATEQPEQASLPQPTPAPAAPNAVPTNMNQSTNANGAQRQNRAPPTKLPMDRALADFLIAAGRATREAERVLAAEGGSVRFDNRDVAATATALFIAYHRDGWLTMIQPTAASPAAEPSTPAVPAPPEPARKPVIAGTVFRGTADQARVAAERIAQLEEQNKIDSLTGPAIVARPWQNAEGMRRVFLAHREALGEVRYSRELAVAGVSDYLQFRSYTRALECHNRMQAIIQFEQEVA